MKNFFLKLSLIPLLLASTICEAKGCGCTCRQDDIQKEKLKEVISELCEIGAVKFGNFTLKNGSQSSVYIDLRRAISRPYLVTKMADLMWEKVSDLNVQTLCGVPYGALALSTSMSFRHDLPLIMARKEVKEHGTRQLIEGVFQKGDEVLIIEDVMTSGSSIVTTKKTLEDAGLEVKHAVVFLDREQGGDETLSSLGVEVRSVITLKELLCLAEKFKSKEAVKKTEHAFMSYADRAELACHPLSKELFLLMEEKKTNLAASADLTCKAELLAFADAVGPHICILKTHADIIEDFDEAFIKELQHIAEKHRFIIFEDRKFADIGNTVRMQYECGTHKIASWSKLINAHSLPGPGLIKALKAVGQPKGAGLVLIPQMSSEGALTDGDYAEKTVEMARNHADYVVGFIAREKLCDDPGFLTMTPGVNLDVTGDALGQQYLTPEIAIGKNGSDVIIVGRGLYKAADPEAMALAYRTAGWNAYLNRQ